MPRTFALEDKWIRLAVRHVRMGRKLQGKFPDGTTFHAYHAFECAVSAYIAARGRKVPPLDKKSGVPVNPKSDHKRKLVLFRHLTKTSDHSNGLFTLVSRYMTTILRNDTLYHNGQTNQFPFDLHRFPSSGLWIKEVSDFVAAVDQDIHDIHAGP